MLLGKVKKDLRRALETSGGVWTLLGKEMSSGGKT